MQSNSIDILVFEKDERDKKLIASYLQKVSFGYSLQLHSIYDKNIILKNLNNKIIIISADSSSSEIFEDVAKLSVRKNNVFIILLSGNIKSSFYTSLLNIGAKNLIRKPLDESSFLNAIYEEYNKLNASKTKTIKRTFTVYSEEKRCGKTLFACNLAKELADKSKERVLLLDFNNSLNDISYVLNLDFELDANYYLRKINEENARKMFSSIVKYKDSNMYIIGTGVMNTNSGDVTQADLYRFLQNAKRFFKYIVIDTDKSKYDVNQYLFTHTDEVFYLVTQNKESLLEHREFLENKIQNDNVKVILSRFRRKMKEDFHVLVSEVEGILNAEVFHFVPNCVLSMSKTIEQKCTLSELNINPVPEIVVSYNKLIRKIIGVMKT